METEGTDKIGVLSSVIGLEDSRIRFLIALETLSRSGKDFQEVLRKIFSVTWIYKILIAFMTYGPMHKAELCLKLFPDSEDSHYKLSRSNQVLSAFNYLLDIGIIIVVKDFGHKKVYYISSSYKPILRALFWGDVFAQLQS